MSDISDIWKFELRRGNSSHPRDGACLLDAVSYLEYGALGDHPACVCPVIAAFGRGINDAMTDAGRQRLKVFIPRLVGTVDRDSEMVRAEYLAWQAIRVFAPMALDAAGMKGQAADLRQCQSTLVEAAEVARAAADDDAAAWVIAAAAGVVRAGAAAGASRAAAHAASRAAASRAADATASSADAAAFAAVAFIENAEDAMIITLDNVLAIGRQAKPLDIQQAEISVRNFELAIS